FRNGTMRTKEQAHSRNGSNSFRVRDKLASVSFVK
ncbi:MAG: hypothetical protein ACI8QD_002998, partial [Cyclobacteriaceae bacterium]